MEDRLGAAQKLINEYPKYLEDFSAEEIIDSGAAMRKLEEFIRESNK